LEGDLTAPPLYITNWQVRNRTAIIGDWLGDPRRLAVEWRPVTLVGHRADKSLCDPFDAATSANDPCIGAIHVGDSGGGSWIEPMVAYCPTTTAADPCDPLATMGLASRLRLSEELGLEETSSVTDVSLWP
jgi:hypothetical protein